MWNLAASHTHITVRYLEAFQLTIRPNPSISYLFLSSNACLSTPLDHWQSLGQPNIVDEVEGLANMHIVNLGALLTFLHFGKMQGSPDY